MSDRAARRITATLLVAGIMPLACSSPPQEEVPRGASPGSTDPEPSPQPSETPTSVDEEGPPRFVGRIAPLPARLRDRMNGTTWKPGCPVPLADLRLLHLDYWGFDGEPRRGPMVVHEDVARDVRWVFRRLFRARFPIKRLALTREFVPEEFEPRISSSRSVTASFNCRPVITPLGPGDDFSQHSYGLAIDINPVQNPYVTADGFVRNTMSRRYLDRARRLPGMIHDGDVVVRSFASIGWSWGGHWPGGKDYMHFSRAGG
jgi:D-alanyl-D-alanine carboxypeptidase